MKILYLGLAHENYNKKRGFSFEHTNFYLTLKNWPKHEILYLPFDRILEIGKKKYNQEIWDMALSEKPDLMFVFMYTDELDKKVLLKIKNETKTKTLCWFADDQSRIYNYSRFWAPYFNFVVTTYSKAPEIYSGYGIKNVIYSQWAAADAAINNQPSTIKKNIDISFIGQATLERKKIVRALENAGINVYVRGFGWKEGKVNQKEIQEIFAKSKINLNLNPPHGLWNFKTFPKLFFERSINKIKPNFHFFSNLRSWLAQRIPHIHARPFELAATRSFIISGYADDFKNYYKEDEEMVFYYDIQDLIKKTRYWLPRDQEREKIAQAAYDRTISEHTYTNRFNKIFKQINLIH